MIKKRKEASDVIDDRVGGIDDGVEVTN